MKSIIAIVLIVIAVVAICAYLFLVPRAPEKPTAKFAEEQAYSLLNGELEESLTNFTLEDIENLLLTFS